MINYIEKGIGLHDRIAELGLPALEFRDGEWWHPDPASVQSIIDGYTLDQARAPLIAQVKALARTKILAFLPDWKQSNLNARMNELNLAKFSRDLTAEEVTEVSIMQALWDRAKAIRAASDAHESNLAALTTFATVLAYDITQDWPE